MPVPQRPRLRALEIKRIRQAGRAYFHMHDPLGLIDKELLVPVELAPALALFDGEHELSLIRSTCLLSSGLDIEPAHLIQLAAQLDDALLLEGERFRKAEAAALDRYRAAAARPPALAERVYPGNARDLTAHLDAFGVQAATRALPAEHVAGILSPHIDYARGGGVYAQGWRQGAAAARRAKLVILLGTDHAGSAGRLTLTRQTYATPWGVLPTDTALVDELADRLGAEEAFGEELHHRMEHSVELAAVWLHYVRGGEPVRVLPVLCGHPGPWLRRRAIGGEACVEAAVTRLRDVVADGALVVVAGDLAHVGPAFGDERSFGQAELRDVELADRALIGACARGANAVLAEVSGIDDRFRICGLTPLALALAIMPPVKLDLAAYDQCPADDANASFVSIAAGCFVRRRAEGDDDGGEKTNSAS